MGAPIQDAHRRSLAADEPVSPKFLRDPVDMTVLAPMASASSAMGVGPNTGLDQRPGRSHSGA